MYIIVLLPFHKTGENLRQKSGRHYSQYLTITTSYVSQSAPSAEPPTSDSLHQAPALLLAFFVGDHRGNFLVKQAGHGKPNVNQPKIRGVPVAAQHITSKSSAPYSF